jgi:hypothetical protein
MSRRGNRRARVGGGRSPFATVASIALSKARSGYQPTLIRASDVAIDGGTTKVQDFVDYFDRAHFIRQTTGASQFAAPAADAAIGGRMSCAAASTSITGLSTRALSTWRYLHDGLGCRFFCVYVPTDLTGVRAVASTTNASGAAGDTGFLLYTNGAQYRLLVQNNGVSVRSLAGGVPVLSAPTIVGYSYATADNPDVQLREKSVVVASGDQAISPSVGDPQAVLSIGGFIGRLVEAWAIPGSLSAAEEALFANYFRSLYTVS